VRSHFETVKNAWRRATQRRSWSDVESVVSPLTAVDAFHTDGLPRRVIPYAIATFFSAFLLFQIQPIIAKMILPWFGGSAAVWTTCLLFFQVVLLMGYSYAHLSVRFLAPRWQASLHAGLLACSLFLLPVVPNMAWKPSGAEEPSTRILGLLATTIGLPYLLLSATSPLLQAWYARRSHGVIPYRLFALSNAGSMLALIGYPFVVEPAIATRSQAILWSVLYTGFILMCGAVALISASANRSVRAIATGGDWPNWKRQLLWLSLAACASTLLLAVTNHLTQNVASVPLGGAASAISAQLCSLLRWPRLV
jgi:hypothetical protein